MKKVGIGVAVLIAAVIAVVNIPAFLLLLALVVGAYWCFTRYMEATSGVRKIVWFSAGVLFSLLAIFNLPGVIALVAGGFVFYMVRKRRNGTSITKKRDPFQKFEQEWTKITTK